MKAKKCIVWLIVVWWAVLQLLFSTAASAQEDEIVVPPDDPFQNVQVLWEEQRHTNNNVLIPSVSGLSDPEVTRLINATMLERLPIETAKAALERAKAWGEELLETPEVQMYASTYRKENLLSVAVSVWGMLDESFDMHRYVTFNFDLLSGYEIPLGSLFQNEEAAFARMEEMISATLQSDFNAYATSTQVLPMPREKYSVGPNGLMVYYPASQYANLSGTCGTFRFLYYELEALFAPDQAIPALLLGNIPRPAQPGEQIRQDALDGKLPGIPATLRAPLAQYTGAYRPVSEPDYTLEEALYTFEEPRMQQAALGSEKFLDEASEQTVTSIRAGLIDQYGLRPGLSTLAEVSALLGEPDAVVMIDEAAAQDRLLVPGQSHLYVIEDEGEQGRLPVTLEYVAGEDGVLHTVILRAQ